MILFYGIICVLFVASFHVSEAFLIRQSTTSSRSHRLTQLSARHNNNNHKKKPLNDMEAMITINVATFCLENGENECSLEDKEALIQTLKEQRALMAKNMDHIDALLQRLRYSRDSELASQQHLDALIKSIELVLDMEVR